MGPGRAASVPDHGVDTPSVRHDDAIIEKMTVTQLMNSAAHLGWLPCQSGANRNTRGPVIAVGRSQKAPELVVSV